MGRFSSKVCSKTVWDLGHFGFLASRILPLITWLHRDENCLFLEEDKTLSFIIRVCSYHETLMQIWDQTPVHLSCSTRYAFICLPFRNRITVERENLTEPLVKAVYSRKIFPIPDCLLLVPPESEMLGVNAIVRTWSTCSCFLDNL